MSPKAKRLLLQYSIAFLIGAAITALAAWGYGAYTSDELYEVMGALCSAFFASGIILAGAGLLVWIANQGQFYFLEYAALTIASKFNHNMKVASESYGDYVDYKVKTGKKTPWLFLLCTGLFFLVVSGVFLGLYFGFKPAE
jgi:hypothetical protein